jgi:DNA-binding NarL/FixJ family response regulator
MMTIRVLIVDDQAPFRSAARAVVETAYGFEVAGEAITGEASLEAVRRLSPDLVLMDVNLPGIDGTEATRRIRGGAPAVDATGAHNAPVVLLLSTYEAADYASRAAECGASGYLSKSDFSPDVLEAAWAAAANHDTTAAS